MSVALFYLPDHSLRRCFHPSDLSCLEGTYKLLLPTAEKTPESLIEFYNRHVGEADVLVTGWSSPPLTEEMIQRAPKLSAILHSAGTIKRLVPRYAWERGIIVGSANEALAIGVAETTLGMIIAGLKNFFGAREWVRQGGWSALSFGDSYPSVEETYRKTIGIISASAVGRQLIRLLKNFDVNILVYDPFLNADQADELGVKSVGLEELAHNSDVLTVHAPSLAETKGLISASVLACLPDRAIVINTARGDIIEQDALVHELQKGRLRAFLDVTSPEPPADDHVLRSLPNVVLTPHIAGAVTNGCFRQGAMVVDQMRALAGRKPIRGQISLERLALMA